MPHAGAAMTIGTTKLVNTHVDGAIGGLPGVFSYAGVPRAAGRLDSEYFACPWRCWTYHYRARRGEQRFEADA